jgi:hypothetical protein
MMTCTVCSARTSAIQRFLAACSAVCILFLAVACRHQAATNPVPANPPTAAELAALQTDQVNTAGWNKAWTNLLNDAEQSFTPSLPRLVAVEVELVVGNPGAPEDQLTLTVLDASGQTLAVVAQNVQSDNSNQVMFMIGKGGIQVSPGETYRLKLNGGDTFGWKYVVGGYENGEATFNRKPLLADARSTFLFRTFGIKQ